MAAEAGLKSRMRENRTYGSMRGDRQAFHTAKYFGRSVEFVYSTEIMKHFARTRLLIGQEGLDKLAAARVVVFGAGGVGSYAIEALARAGIGTLVLVDFDLIDVSNINRQLAALHSTVGRVKVEVVKERILDINPAARVMTRCEKVTPENVDSFIMNGDAYVVDAVDDVRAKCAIIERGIKLNIPVISALGAGNRLDPLKLTIADISETFGCPLARTVRASLRKKGITHGVEVVYSRERPRLGLEQEAETEARTGVETGMETANDRNTAMPASKAQRIIGSISFVPAAAGLLLAAQVINELLKNNNKQRASKGGE